MSRAPGWRLSAAAFAIYAASRGIALVCLLFVEQQLRGREFPGGPPFRLWWDAIERWDAIFYRMATTDGYPTVLPTDGRGDVLANVWAFFPVFPFATRVVSQVTGLAFTPAAVLLNVSVGAIAAVCLALLVRRFGDDAAALRAVGLWACFPTAFVLQVPYSEACYAALSIGFLLALVAGRPMAAGGLLLGAALSRGFIIPLSAAALVFVVREIWTRRAARRPWAVVTLAVAALLAPWLWMLIAALVTGRADAYTATQGVWGFSFEFATAMERWGQAFGSIGRDWYFTGTVALLVLTVVVASLGWITSMPAELRVYALVACLFLLAISQPGSVAIGSVPRFAFGILSIPIVLGLLLPNTAAIAVALASLGFQYLWVMNIWSGKLGVAP